MLGNPKYTGITLRYRTPRSPQSPPGLSPAVLRVCEICDRRMYGQFRRNSAYYVCRRDDRHHAQRRDWYDDHPKSVWVREDDLIDLTHRFLADHVLGPRRHDALPNTRHRPEPAPDATAIRLQAELAHLDRRQQNLLTQIEEYEPTGDDDIDRDLRSRCAEIARQHKATSDRLVALIAHHPPEPDDDPTILDELPIIAGADLTTVPDDLLRDLYDSFNLEVRYRSEDRSATIRVTIKADRLPDLRSALDRPQTLRPNQPPLTHLTRATTRPPTVA